MLRPHAAFGVTCQSSQDLGTDVRSSAAWLAMELMSRWYERRRAVVVVGTGGHIPHPLGAARAERRRRHQARGAKSERRRHAAPPFCYSTAEDRLAFGRHRVFAGLRFGQSALPSGEDERLHQGEPDPEPPCARSSARSPLHEEIKVTPLVRLKKCPCVGPAPGHRLKTGCRHGDLARDAVR
jgi:hypothetical protein